MRHCEKEPHTGSGYGRVRTWLLIFYEDGEEVARMIVKEEDREEWSKWWKEWNAT